MLVVSAAANTGYLALAESFQWLGTTAALVAFAVAALVESGAYYVPWLDNLLDTIASPMACPAVFLPKLRFALRKVPDFDRRAFVSCQFALDADKLPARITLFIAPVGIH
jgi:hypothetical protein